MKKGNIIGACLDVLEYESSSFEGLNETDNADFEFLKANKKVILSPHIAGWTIESKTKLAVFLAEKIINFCKNE